MKEDLSMISLIGAALTRIGMDVCGVVCVGAALLGPLVPGRAARVPDRVLLVASGAWLGLFVGLVLSLLSPAGGLGYWPGATEPEEWV